MQRIFKNLMNRFWEIGKSQVWVSLKSQTLSNFFTTLKNCAKFQKKYDIRTLPEIKLSQTDRWIIRYDFKWPEEAARTQNYCHIKIPRINDSYRHSSWKQSLSYQKLITIAITIAAENLCGDTMAIWHNS